MPIIFLKCDITQVWADAVVNSANRYLKPGGGVCRAIFRAAGKRELTAACKKLAPIKTGEAVITPAFMLPAKYIIHTAAPVYRDGRHNEAELLRLCYRNSLELAVKNDCNSVAFPVISSGIYGYPKNEALHIAIDTIENFLNREHIKVYLVTFDKILI